MKDLKKFLLYAFLSCMFLSLACFVGCSEDDEDEEEEDDSGMTLKEVIDGLVGDYTVSASMKTEAYNADELTALNAAIADATPEGDDAQIYAYGDPVTGDTFTVAALGTAGVKITTTVGTAPAAIALEAMIKTLTLNDDKDGVKNDYKVSGVVGKIGDLEIVNVTADITTSGQAGLAFTVVFTMDKPVDGIITDTDVVLATVKDGVEAVAAIAAVVDDVTTVDVDETAPAVDAVVAVSAITVLKEKVTVVLSAVTKK